MDKSLLLDAIVDEITVAIANSLAAAEEARATATTKKTLLKISTIPWVWKRPILRMANLNEYFSWKVTWLHSSL